MSAAYAETIPAAQPFASARAYGEELERTLSGDGMLRAEHSEVELLVAKSGREWARLMLEAQFSMRADLEKFVEVVGADGAERTRAKDSERHLETVVGKIAVPRIAYQAGGCEDLHPMDAAPK